MQRCAMVNYEYAKSTSGNHYATRNIP